MKNKTLFLIGLLLTVSVIAYSQNIVGKWKMPASVGNVVATSGYQFNRDGSGTLFITASEKVSDAKFRLSKQMTSNTPISWEIRDKQLIIIADMEETEISVKSKVTLIKGTAAERAQAQQEADYYSQIEEDNLYASLNMEETEDVFEIVSATSTTLKLINSNGETITLRKVTGTK